MGLTIANMRFLLIVLFAGSISAQTISFRAPRDFIGGIEPCAIVQGDFNGDGILDVVIADVSGYDFIAGNGDGTFRPAVNSPSGFLNQTVAADFDGDGYLDLASINTYDDVGTVSISLGNGDGTFRAAIPYSLPGVASSIAAGDFDGDGIPDIACSIRDNAIPFGGSLSVLLSRGNGTFGGPIVTNGTGSIYGIAAADLNGDGKLDLATIDVTPANGYMQVFLGNGLGSFVAGRNAVLNANPVPSSLAISDLNGDGVPDVAVAGSLAAYVFTASGFGGYHPAMTYPVLDGSTIAIADVDGDKNLDLLVGDLLENGVSVLRGNGDGTFLPQLFVATGSSVTGIAAGHFNNDLIDDFVAACQGSDVISVFLGNPSLRFNAPVIPVPAPNAIVAADFNGDGNPDFAASTIVFGLTQTPVIVALGDGKGGFIKSGAIEIPSAGSLIAGDFNNDGKEDVVAVSSNSISTLLGNGAGQLGTPHQMVIARGLGTGVTADFNHDGKLDLAITVTYGNQVAILLGNGDGSFQHPVLIPVCSQPYGIASADLNHDGLKDLVVACQNSHFIAALFGAADGAFQVPRYYEAGQDPQYIALGDVNSDGNVDVAVSNLGSSITLLLGDGSGGFLPGRSLSVCPSNCFPRALEIVDVNGDGKLDIAVAAQETNALAVLQGNGDGTFESPVYFGTGSGPVELVSGRFSGRRRPDFLVVNGLFSQLAGISILLNNSY